MLADGTNLGLARMADESRGLGYHHLVIVAQWHIGDDNYVAARAAIVNAPRKHPMAAIWDDGTTSSSDEHISISGPEVVRALAVPSKPNTASTPARFSTRTCPATMDRLHAGHFGNGERSALRARQPAPSCAPDRSAHYPQLLHHVPGHGS
jgi:hypothetical protein